MTAISSRIEAPSIWMQVIFLKNLDGITQFSRSR